MNDEKQSRRKSRLFCNPTKVPIDKIISDIPELLHHQRNSYNAFLQKGTLPEALENRGLHEILSKAFPVKGKNAHGTYLLEYLNYEARSPVCTVSQAYRLKLTYGVPVYAKFRMTVCDPSETKCVSITEEDICIAILPIPTDNSTFIINGVARTITSQAHRASGMFFDHSKKSTDDSRSFTGRLIPYKGCWIDMDFDAKRCMFVRIDRKRKNLISTFLMSIGYSKETLLQEFYTSSIYRKRQDGNWEVGFQKSFWESQILTHQVFSTEGASLFQTGSKVRDTSHIPATIVVPSIALNGLFLAKDIVGKDGIVVAEAGHRVTNELISTYDELTLLDIRESSPSSSVALSCATDKCVTQWDAISEIIRSLRPGESVPPETAKTFLNEIFFSKTRYDLSEVGRTKINERTGADYTDLVLRKEDIIGMVRVLLDIMMGRRKIDDQDSFQHKRLRDCSELLAVHCKPSVARISANARDRMTQLLPSDAEPIMPNAVLLTKPFGMAVRDFFNSSQLSQLLDQANVLAESSHKRRISATGPGGLTREYTGFDARDVHPSHYGRACPMTTPEGSAVGLVNSLAMQSRINKHGFLESEYLVVKNGVITDESKFCTYSEEFNKVIAHYQVTKDENNRIIGTVPCRYNDDIIEANPEQIDLIDKSPLQILSLPVASIPYMNNNDPSRALMGANMGQQALPLEKPEAPLVCTGIESKVARDSGSMIMARNSGTIKYIDHAIIIVEPHDKSLPNDSYSMIRFAKSNASTMIHQSPLPELKVGDEIEKGEVLADCASTHKGEIALGRNILIAFMPWKGYNYEDAAVVSKRIVDEKLLTSVHVSSFETAIHKTKAGSEVFTSDIPNIHPELLAKLDANGIIRKGAEVKYRDILAGKISYERSGEGEVPEEKLLRSIFGDKSAGVQDLSLRVPPGVEGTVIDVQPISRSGCMTEDEISGWISEEQSEIKHNHEISLSVWFDRVKPDLLALDSVITDDPSVQNLLSREEPKDLTWTNLAELPMKELFSLKLDDKSGTFKKLQTQFKELHDQYLQQLQDVARSYRASSDELPIGVLKSVRILVASERELQRGDKLAGRHGNKCVVSTVVPQHEMPYMEDGTPIDMILNPLGVPSRMNLGQIFEMVSGMIVDTFRKQLKIALAANDIPRMKQVLSNVYNTPAESITDEQALEDARLATEQGLGILATAFCSASSEQLDDLSEAAGIEKGCKFKLFDGQTGEEIKGKVAVGMIYITRLNHDVKDKAHARSTGPYNRLNNQPLGGKANFGGQRVGEMEVWGLQGHGAAYTLLEMLTVKSDDPDSRMRAFDAFVRGDDRFSVGTPESFKIFCLYAQSLCIKIKTTSASGDKPIIPALSDYSITTNLDDIEIKFSLASPDEILSWSHGALSSVETNYHKTDRPVNKGLFCARVFGPVVNYECNCGKYKRMKYNGIVCEKCEVGVTHSKVRRERMGHIALPCPVTHIWFTHILPSRIGILLNMSIPMIEAILACEVYVVTNPGEMSYSYGQFISSKEYDKIVLNCDEEEHLTFDAQTGGEAIETLLKAINLEEETMLLRSELAKSTSEVKRKKILKKLELVQNLISSNTRPEWMVLRILPVLPAGLRPIVMIDEGHGRPGTVGVNGLYKTVITRAQRLEQLRLAGSPLEVMRNEQRGIQQAVDTLFDNGRNGSPVNDNNGRRYRSLGGNFKGKQGMCRQDMLGKRVDYSGRSVIVVGPELRLDQCAIPRRMALELFKPHVLAKLESYGLAPTLRAAKKLIEQEIPEVWDILTEVIKNRPILLNRAPTLHRLGIQAFHPVLTDGNAIKIHPLVCSAFNADFDGDQMAVHVPLSVEARLEAHYIMLSTQNLLSAANGMPVVVPSQDIVLGLYELTHTYETAPLVDRSFSSMQEVLQAVELHNLPIQASIRVMHEGEEFTTTPGRVIFYQVVPKGVPFSRINMTFDKKNLGIILYEVHKTHGSKEMARFADAIKDEGFKWATKCGITIGKNDLVTIPTLPDHINEAKAKIREHALQEQDGLLAPVERAGKDIDVWVNCTEKITEDMVKTISRPTKDGLNPIYKMYVSSARGSRDQLRQAIAVRGLTVGPGNMILPTPVLSNYRDGLSPIELFNSTYGTRKGSTDTALKTSSAGHLTRKLVEACQGCLIEEQDCGTSQGLRVNMSFDGSGSPADLFETVKGRVLAEPVLHPKTQAVLIPAGTLITSSHMDQLKFVRQAVIRSPVKCKNPQGLCAQCYGLDLSKDKLVEPGELVGIIAAQSIGEPGAQLTMNTFHSGGVVQHATSARSVVAPVDVKVSFTGRTIQDVQGNKVVVSRSSELVLEDNEGLEIARHRLPYGSYLVKQESAVAGECVANWDPYNNTIIAEAPGEIIAHDLVEGVSLIQEMDEITGVSRSVICEWKHHIVPHSFQPRLELKNPETGKSVTFALSPGTNLEVQSGQACTPGQILAKLPKASFMSQDITGGLPRVSELLDARQQSPASQAILSDIDGQVEYDGEHRGRAKVIIRGADGEKIEYIVPQRRSVVVQEGEIVRKGDQITDGTPSAQQILKTMGVDALASYLIREILQIYQSQGASINQKHIELVIKRMLRKQEIVDPGDSHRIVGNYVESDELEHENAELIAANLKPIVTKPCLMGITSSAMNGRSVISSASFQHGVRTIVKAALAGSRNKVHEPKESVICGTLMHGGTGYAVRQLLQQARKSGNWVNATKKQQRHSKIHTSISDIK